MTSPGKSRKWLPLAVAAAVTLSNPFMMIAVGATLGLIFVFCDNRALYRRAAGLALLPALALAGWIDPLLTFFAASAAGTGVLILRKNVFSTVTSGALVSSLLAAALTGFLIWETGPVGWQRIEQKVVEAQQQWREMTAGATGGAEETEAGSEAADEAWQRWNALAVKIIPGHFVLMMIASFFISVLLYRRFGQSREHLSLGCSHFNQYRFEDNWIWLVVTGLVMIVFFSSSEGLMRLAVNILFVMGVLYIIRGLAVMFYFVASRNGGMIMRILLLVLCLTPAVLLHLLFGVLDTWVDFRRAVPAAQ